MLIINHFLLFREVKVIHSLFVVIHSLHHSVYHIDKTIQIDILNPLSRVGEHNFKQVHTFIIYHLHLAFILAAIN